MNCCNWIFTLQISFFVVFVAIAVATVDAAVFLCNCDFSAIIKRVVFFFCPKMQICIFVSFKTADSIKLKFVRFRASTCFQILLQLCTRVGNAIVYITKWLLLENTTKTTSEAIAMVVKRPVYPATSVSVHRLLFIGDTDGETVVFAHWCTRFIHQNCVSISLPLRSPFLSIQVKLKTRLYTSSPRTNDCFADFGLMTHTQNIAFYSIWNLDYIFFFNFFVDIVVVVFFINIPPFFFLSLSHFLESSAHWR